MKAIFPLVIFLLLFSCNNQPKQNETVLADSTKVDTSVIAKRGTVQPALERTKTPPPVGMQGISGQQAKSKTMARAVVAPAAVERNVFENKDTQTITKTEKVYTETIITIQKYNPGNPPVNKPPTANAGADKTITLPTNNTQLAGTGTDPDGTISSYAWSKVSGGAATLSSTTSATTNVTGLVQGQYVFRLTVKDNGGATGTDEVNVVVNPVPPTGSGYLSLPLSGIIDVSGKSDVVIENLQFKNTVGASIKAFGSRNITIRNCFFNGSTREAIDMNGSSNITITNNLFARVETGVYALNCQTVKVNNNQFVNVRKRVGDGGGRGQFVQFNSTGGAGCEIMNNKGENFLGESDPEDLISLYASSGTSSSPIKISGNVFRGGGPSGSGGGIIAGDHGGGNVIMENNVLLNPGQYGMAVAGGQNITIRNNKIFAKQQSFTNNPLYVWSQEGGDPCSSINVSGNFVNWTDKDGNKNTGWNANNCGSSYNPGENKTISEAEMNVPAHLIDFVTPQQLLSIRK